MTGRTIRTIIERAVAGRRLLEHPFYRRWSRGELTVDDLREYAGQYRTVEGALPGWLQAVRDGATDPGLRTAVQRNLEDEAGGAVTHLALFDQFMTGLGASTSAPTAVTHALIAAHDKLVSSSPVEGLAAILAYEVQSPEVSRSKAAGLRRHHGLDGDAVAFWDTHAAVDGDHAAWTADALAASGADVTRVYDAASRAAAAWWAFLDEREMRSAGVGA